MRPDEPDAARFAWQMEMLASLFHVLPLGDAVTRLREGTLPARVACVTFDDGYADNYEIALPILERFGVPATFFVATGFLDGGRMFNDTVIETVRHLPKGDLDLSDVGLGRYSINSIADRRACVHGLLRHLKYAELEQRKVWLDRLTSYAPCELPSDLMMCTNQVIDLYARGMEIGAHTVNHPILARQSLSEARAEIERSRLHLQRITGDGIRLFAYPNGRLDDDFHEEHRAIVEDLGFLGAVTTERGVATADTDAYLLPRFTPWDRSRLRYVARLAHNVTQTR